MNQTPRYRRAMAPLCATATILASMILSVAVADSGRERGPGAARNGHGLLQGKPQERSEEHERRGRAPQVAEPQSVVAGKSIAEWTSDHVRWAVSFPVDQNPVFTDETGELAHLGDVGGPVFFAGAAGDVQRRFDVPCGKYLLVPLLTQIGFLDATLDEATARAENSAFVDSVTTLHARIDGRRVRDVFEYREASPEVFGVSVPDGGIFGDVGGQFDAVADGYWLMIEPLPSGTHTIVVGGESPAYEFGYIARFEVTVPRGCRKHH